MAEIGSSEFAHQLEQAEAGIQATAQFTSAYYHALVREGLPLDLIYELVKDYTQMILMRTLFGSDYETD